MDTSETYIKMCEKAVEVQGEWQPAIGDYNWHRYTMFGEEIDSQIWTGDKRVEITIIHTKSSIGDWWVATNEQGEERTFNGIDDFHKQTCVFLPRQDQLQEMVIGKYRDWPDPMRAMLLEHHFFTEHDEQSLTVEQLWLAFVMKEKYNKVWDGNDWIEA